MALSILVICGNFSVEISTDMHCACLLCLWLLWMYLHLLRVSRFQHCPVVFLCHLVVARQQSLCVYIIQVAANNFHYITDASDLYSKLCSSIKCILESTSAEVRCSFSTFLCLFPFLFYDGGERFYFLVEGVFELICFLRHYQLVTVYEDMVANMNNG